MRQIYLHGLGQAPSALDPVLSRLDFAGDRVCPGPAGLLRGFYTRAGI